MTVQTLSAGPYGTNCYLLREGESCLLIDPGDDAPAILARVRSEELTVRGILLTHGHFDHVGAVKAIAAQTGCPVWLHEADRQLKPRQLYPLSGWTDPCLRQLREGMRIPFGQGELQVLSTPGHTPGSVCFLFGDCLFSGDTLFAGSCGRTDLPGGSGSQLRQSLARLAGLPETLTVYPGHGPSTSLAEELRYNPYL